MVKIKELAQCPSEDLETGSTKLTIVIFWGVLFFKGDKNILTGIYSLISGIILFYNVMGIILKWRNFKHMLEIDILRNNFPTNMVTLRGDFWGFGCPKEAQTPCWLRLWIGHFQIILIRYNIDITLIP